MLYIVTERPDPSPTIVSFNISKDYTWHVGEEKPKIPEGHTVVLVQADGDELEYIGRTFRDLDGPNTMTIPWAQKCLVMKWRGDFAAFIADNL